MFLSIFSISILYVLLTKCKNWNFNPTVWRFQIGFTGKNIISGKVQHSNVSFLSLPDILFSVKSPVSNWKTNFVHKRTAAYSQKIWGTCSDRLLLACSPLGYTQTANRLAGIITQPVRLILRSEAATLKPAADCDMDSPAEENMLSDSRLLLLSLLLYSCGLWAAVWNCGPADDEPGSWNIYRHSKQSRDGSEAEQQNMKMKRSREENGSCFSRKYKRKTTRYKFPSH